MKIIGAIVLLVLIARGFAREGRVIRLEQLYEDNKEFREYVDRYSEKHGISVDAAMKHKIVAIVAKDRFEYEV